jgi:hypothetical protein
MKCRAGHHHRKTPSQLTRLSSLLHRSASWRVAFVGGHGLLIVPK